MDRDDPRIRPIAFLYAVMRDCTLPIQDRVTAAGHLLHIEPDGPPQVSMTIRIGGMPTDKMQELFESFSEEIQRDLRYIQRCYEQGYEGPFDISDMPVKGRA